jgi:glucose-1-phosphate adenylyltransferase
MKDVLTLILGGGRGTRLFPLTHTRAKPAVPIGGKYRLIDVPISNCLHADLTRIFVLTQFNSASLNRHISQTYRLDAFRGGFVEILAAEQTPDSANWFQGTADAVRQAMRHFVGYGAEYYLVLAGDHLYRMDLSALIAAHIATGADITVATQPASFADAGGLGVFLFDRNGQISAFEEKPSPARLTEIGCSVPAGAPVAWRSEEKPFVGSMGIYVFTAKVLLDVLECESGIDFGREVIPAALGRRHVRAYPYDGYWADVGTVESFYRANLMTTAADAPFRFYDTRRPIYTHPRYLPGSRLDDATVRRSVITEGCSVGRAIVEDSIVGIRTRICPGATVRRSVLLGADFYESEDESPREGAPPLGIGRDAVLDGVIVDKNARIGDGVRLVNDRHVEHLDGDGFYVRNGIIIVPKGGVVRQGL